MLQNWESGIEEWAQQMVSDYRALTGFPIAHAWQQAHGKLQPGRRLVPKRPFVLGGNFALENLYDIAAGEGMRVRAELAVQIRDLPDGATVRYSVE